MSPPHLLLTYLPTHPPPSASASPSPMPRASVPTTSSQPTHLLTSHPTPHRALYTTRRIRLTRCRGVCRHQTSDTRYHYHSLGQTQPQTRHRHGHSGCASCVSQHRDRVVSCRVVSCLVVRCFELYLSLYRVVSSGVESSQVSARSLRC
jgi:hypothetical protein